MKILFISYNYWPPHFGGELILGIERFESLAQRGHTVTVLTSGLPSVDYPSKEIVDGITILRSPAIGSTRLARGFRRITFGFWMLWHLLRIPCDVIHIASTGGVNALSSNLLIWLIGWIGRFKHAKTVSVHSLAFFESNASAVPKLWYLKTVSHVVSVAPALHVGVKKVLPKSAVLLTYSIRDDIFTPISTEERTKYRNQLGLSSEDVIFTFLGSITYRKGFDVLAEAFAKLSKTHPTWRLVVIGPRTKEENQNINPEEVEEVTGLLENNPHVKYLGRINDHEQLADLLGMSDVFVFPSRREGFGLAPVEAMAAGVPPIIARIPGVTDLASIHQETGLYVTPGSVDELEQAMLFLGENPAIREEMGRKAHERAAEAFGWEPYINKWEQLYVEGHVSQ